MGFFGFHAVTSQRNNRNLQVEQRRGKTEHGRTTDTSLKNLKTEVSPEILNGVGKRAKKTDNLLRLKTNITFVVVAVVIILLTLFLI